MAAAVSRCTIRCESFYLWNNHPLPFLSAAGAKALVCDQCGAQFSKEDALETHRQAHTGTWPFHPLLRHRFEHLGCLCDPLPKRELHPLQFLPLAAQAGPVLLTLKHRFRHQLVKCCYTTAQH